MRSSTDGQMLLRLSPLAAAPSRWPGCTSPSSVMSSTGTTTSMSMVFAAGGCTTVTGLAPPRKRATSSTGRTVAERPTRCAGWPSRASTRPGARAGPEPLERQREVGAALAAGDGMDLVDDYRLHPAQRLARLRGEQEEQRL